MTVVIDASVACAALLPGDANSEWARGVLDSQTLVGPELLVVEVSHLLRRSVRGGVIPDAEGRAAIGDLVNIIDEFFEHAPFAERIWDLHPNVTSYDAVYVALAEALGAPLATLDHKLRRAPGPRCDFLSPS